MREVSRYAFAMAIYLSLLDNIELFGVSALLSKAGVFLLLPSSLLLVTASQFRRSFFDNKSYLFIYPALVVAIRVLPSETSSFVHFFGLFVFLTTISFQRDQHEKILSAILKGFPVFILIGVVSSPTLTADFSDDENLAGRFTLLGLNQNVLGFVSAFAVGGALIALKRFDKVAVVFVGALVLALTGSRAALGALVLFLVWYSCSSKKFGRGVVLMTVVVLGVGLSSLGGASLAGSRTLETLSVMSMSGRELIWLEFFSSWSVNVFGLPLDQAADLFTFTQVFSSGSLHNVFLELLLLGGIASLLSFLAFTFLNIGRAISLRCSFGVLSWAIVLLVCAFNQLFDKAFFMYLIAVAIALARVEQPPCRPDSAVVKWS
jgi:hypothetical protein